MINTIILAIIRAIVLLYAAAAVKEAVNKQAWPLITDLVTGLFFALLAWYIGGWAP